MANYELVFDLGSQYISAGLKEDGFIDKIPSVVAYGSDSKQIVAVGLEALSLAKSKGNVKISHPVLEGAAIEPEGVKALVSYLIKRLISQRINVFNRFLATCVVPCGMISGDKKNIESIFLALGARQVTFVETPIADSVKLFAEFRTRNGIVVDMGHECTDLAVVYGDGIVAGCTLYYGGKQLTENIERRLSSKYMSKVPTDQAEYLKTNCASLYSNDTTVVAVTSQNTQNGATETLNVTSKELYDTIVEFVTQYVKVIESLLSSIPQDLQATVKSEGVFVCGGGAKLPGLDMFLQNELGIPVRIASRPEYVSIEGAMAWVK